MVYGRYNELSSIHGRVYKQAYNGGPQSCSRRKKQLLVDFPEKLKLL